MADQPLQDFYAYPGKQFGPVDKLYSDAINQRHDKIATMRLHPGGHGESSSYPRHRTPTLRSVSLKHLIGCVPNGRSRAQLFSEELL